jgi:hypothetical protein
MRRLFGVYRNLLLTCAGLDGISDGKSEVTFEKVDVDQAYTVLVDDRVDMIDAWVAGKSHSPTLLPPSMKVATTAAPL